MSFTGLTADSLSVADDLPERLAAAISARLNRCEDGGRFAPELSYGRHFGPAPIATRPAAVIALMFRRGGRWHIPLTVRPDGLARHGGQISLPGGILEPGEASDQAAVRELREELGVCEPVELLGCLSDCYVYASDFLVTPWLAATRHEPVWRPQSAEVERLIELPLGVLLDPRTVGTMVIKRGPVVFRAPCYRIGDDCAWGATAIILTELSGLLRHCHNHRTANLVEAHD